MWQCAQCSAAVPQGAICPECGQAIQPALSEISRKARHIRIGRNVAARWVRRGAVTGFVIGSVLSLTFAGILVVRHLISPPWQETMLDVFAVFLCVFVLVAVFFLPMLFAVIYLIFGSVIKPILIAIFCSIERFEREYGSTKQ